MLTVNYPKYSLRRWEKTKIILKKKKNILSYVLLIQSGPYTQATVMLLCHNFGSLSELCLVCIRSALNELKWQICNIG